MKDIVEIVQGIVTIVAILAGGIWTYLAFVRKRLRYPRAKLSITIDSSQIAPDYRLVHVAVQIDNTGYVLLAPEYAEVRLRQVMPLPAEIESRLKPGFDPVAPDEKELPWPLIVRREWNWDPSDIEIEPGESDLLNADFVIIDTVEIVQIYTFVRNPKKRRTPRGWGATLLHTFPIGQGEIRMADCKKRVDKLTDNQQRQQKQLKAQQQQQQQQQAKQSAEAKKKGETK